MIWYFDHNAFNGLLNGGPSAKNLSEALRATGDLLIVSERNVQEAVSCWKSGKPELAIHGQRLVRYMLEIEPVEFLLPLPHLIRFEVRKLIDQSLPGPFLNGQSLNLTRGLLGRFALGDLNDGGIENLKRQWTKKERERDFYEQLRSTGFNGGWKRASDFVTFVKENQRLARITAERVASAIWTRWRSEDNVRRRKEQPPAFRSAPPSEPRCGQTSFSLIV